MLKKITKKISEKSFLQKLNYTKQVYKKNISIKRNLQQKKNQQKNLVKKLRNYDIFSSELKN